MTGSWQAKYKTHLTAKKITLLEMPSQLKDRVSHKCLKCSHVWVPQIGNVWGDKSPGAGSGCPKCALAAIGKARTARCEVAFRQVLSAHPGVTAIGTYASAVDEMKFRFACCGKSYRMTPQSLQRRNFRCPGCYERQVRGIDEEVKTRALKTLKSKRIDLLDPYQGTAHKHRMRCLVCDSQWSPVLFSILSGTGCPTCSHRSALRFKSKPITVQGVRFYVQGYEGVAIRWAVRNGVDPHQLQVGKSQVDSFQYLLSGKTHRYFPDIVAGKRVIEVKSMWTAGLYDKQSKTSPSFAMLQAKANAVISTGRPYHLLILRDNRDGTWSKAVLPEGWTSKPRDQVRKMISWKPLT